MPTYDKSLAGKTNFILVFDKAPKVQYFCQEVNIPAISLSGTELNMGRLAYNEVGGNLVFDELAVLFLADENLNNYKEIYDWFLSLRHPEAGNPNLNVTSSEDKSDAVVTILDNNKNPKVRFTFIDCWPTGLDGLVYDVKSEGDDPQVVALSLSYSHFTMEVLS